jgi:hypothetical protein
VSILVVQIVPEGLLFGADRNITSQLTLRDGTQDIVVTGQSERPKVLKWPNREVIVGYVGAAQVQAQATDQWLYAFIGRHLDFSNLEEVARALTRELDAPYQANDFSGPMILHLGGFELLEREWTPRVFYIRNTARDLPPEGTYTVTDHFDCSEELGRPEYYGAKGGNTIRNELRTQIFSFRQGYDLGSFSVIDEALHEALGVIIHNHPRRPHPAPATLAEWSKHVAFKIHGYAAYFAAFYPPFQQYVGGGADVVYATWPAP